MDEIIVEEIKWTDTAKLSFSKIIHYLDENWSEKEILKFINRTEEVLLTLQRYPEMCRPSLKRKNVRIALLNKHTQMIYHYNPKKRRIEILLFWGMKQNPAKFKY
jgi:plasmid stabilization system protein ParE